MTGKSYILKGAKTSITGEQPCVLCDRDNHHEQYCMSVHQNKKRNQYSLPTSEDWLNGLAFAYVHRDVDVDVDRVL